MPANAWQVHAEIDRTVCKVDECSRAFDECWEHAKVVLGAKDKEKHATELKRVISLLRQHKAQIRKWTAQNSVPPSAKDKLKDASAKIDRDFRRFQEFEQAIKTQASQAPGQENIAPAQEGVKLAGPGAGHGEKGDEEDSSPEVKVQWDQLLNDGSEDCEMIDEFVCKICQVHVVGNNPKLSRCSHLYCGDCIAQWFAVHPRSQTWAQRASAAGSVPCPVCKEPLKEDTDLFPVCAEGRTESAFLFRMLSGLRIVCANNPRCRKGDGQCDWTGEYGQFQEHMRSCKNLPLGKPQATKKVRAPLPNPAEEDPTPSAQSQTPQPKEGGKPAPIADAWDADETSTEEPATPPMTRGESPGGSDGGDSVPAVVVDAPDAEASATSSPVPEPAAPDAAASSQPASLTDLIQALVDLKVQEYTQKGSQAPEAASAPLVQEQPAPQPAVSEPAAAASSAAVRAVLAYAASGPSQLSLAQGDLVEVLERNQSGWTFGRRVQSGSEGWFPEWSISAP